MFLDECEIVVSSGRGGDGVVSFRREKYAPKGGPDGGDGGRGGDVVFVAVDRLNTLASIQPGRHYRASHGEAGGGRLRHGANGAPVELEVPVGTLLRDAERGHVLRDLAEPGARVVIASGGTGGRGNKHFSHATNQTPRRATEGRPGESRRLRLELRLVADVGLVGLPNAGKSTLLSRISAARPKVADYPFTTLTPVLGLVEVGDDAIVVADIPGLIEGAHEGAGLGDRFLRHVARTRVLLHLVDAGVGPEQAVADWRTIRGELALAGLGLDQKDVVLALSKTDAAAEVEATREALAAAADRPVLVFSAVTGAGLPEVLGALRERVDAVMEKVREAERPRRPRVVPPHLRDDGPDAEA